MVEAYLLSEIFTIVGLAVFSWLSFKENVVVCTVAYGLAILLKIYILCCVIPLLAGK